MQTPSMLTTVDNPYDPFTEWEQWLAFDTGNKYFTCELLAKIAGFSDSDSDEEKDEKADNAMDFLAENSPLHLVVHPKNN